MAKNILGNGLRRDLPVFAASALLVMFAVRCDSVPTRPQARDYGVRHSAFWRKTEFSRKALEDRVQYRASPELLVYLNQENSVQGYPNHPEPTDPDASFRSDFREAIRELPPILKETVSPFVFGIVIVRDLGGTGFTDVVYDDGGKTAGTFLVFDSEALRRKANEWLSWRENTPFRSDKRAYVRYKIEPEATDNRRNAIQFILLHELGHVFSQIVSAHPSWTVPIKARKLDGYEFARLSWSLDPSGKYVSKWDAPFPERSVVRYYRDPENALPASQILSVYDHLVQTDFPSLYAANGPEDDFAETFAIYVHSVLLGRPYRGDVVRDGKVVRSVRSCLLEPRCKEKRDLLERYFKTAAPRITPVAEAVPGRP